MPQPVFLSIGAVSFSSDHPKCNQVQINRLRDVQLGALLREPVAAQGARRDVLRKLLSHIQRR